MQIYTVDVTLSDQRLALNVALNVRNPLQREESTLFSFFFIPPNHYKLKHLNFSISDK